MSTAEWNRPVPGRPTTLQFAVAANSFFPILVFNELLRGPEPGSMALIPAGSMLPATLYRQPCARPSSSSIENFRQANRSIWLCDGKTDSRFSILKTPIRLRCHRPVAQHTEEDSDFKRVCHRARPAGRRQRQLEGFQSARRCNRSRSTSSLMANPNR